MYEVGDEISYEGQAERLSDDDGETLISGRFKVVEVGGDSALLEDVRADWFEKEADHARDLHRYRVKL